MKSPPALITHEDLAALDLVELDSLYDALRVSIAAILAFTDVGPEGLDTPATRLANHLLVAPLGHALAFCVDAVRNATVETRSDRERRALVLYRHSVEYDATDRATQKVLLEALEAIAEQPHGAELDNTIAAEEANRRAMFSASPAQTSEETVRISLRTPDGFFFKPLHHQ